MILRKARVEDKEMIEKAWKMIFSQDDHGHSNYYFKHEFSPHQCFILTNDEDELISSCQVHTKTIQLAQKFMDVSFIVGIFTMPKYRNHGYMKQMLNQVIDIEAHKHHFTFIQAYDPTLYLAYGFEPIYQRSVYSLEVNQVPVLSSSGLSYQLSFESMATLYKQFTSHFDGFVKRELDDFKRLQLEVSAQEGKIIGYFNQDRLEAYACVLFENNKVIFDELVYLNANALLKCLNAFTSLNQTMQLRVSPKENLRKLIPNAVIENEVNAFVRLNHPLLFNELFKVNISSAQEAFLLAQKPLWFRENQ